MENQSKSARLIRRYKNRKLFDPVARKDVSARDIVQMVKEDMSFIVADTQTKEDVTTRVLAHVILTARPSSTAISTRIEQELIATIRAPRFEVLHRLRQIIKLFPRA